MIIIQKKNKKYLFAPNKNYYYSKNKNYFCVIFINVKNENKNFYNNYTNGDTVIYIFFMQTYTSV